MGAGGSVSKRRTTATDCNWTTAAMYSSSSLPNKSSSSIPNHSGHTIDDYLLSLRAASAAFTIDAPNCAGTGETVGTVFRRMDTDGSGRLNFRELDSALRDLGFCADMMPACFVLARLKLEKIHDGTHGVVDSPSAGEEIEPLINLTIAEFRALVKELKAAIRPSRPSLAQQPTLPSSLPAPAPVSGMAKVTPNASPSAVLSMGKPVLVARGVPVRQL